MGLCHSACGSRAYELEYYNEAYRHQVRFLTPLCAACVSERG